MKLNLVLDNVVLQSTGVEAIYDDITTTITSTITETSTLYYETIPTLLKRAPAISTITSIPISTNTSTSSNDNSKSSGKAVAIAVPIIAIMMIIIAILIVWNVRRRRRSYDSENDDDDEMYVSSEEDEKDKEKEREVKYNTYNSTKVNVIPPSTATSFASVCNTIPWNKSVRDTSPFITLPSERDIAMLKTNK